MEQFKSFERKYEKSKSCLMKQIQEVGQSKQVLDDFFKSFEQDCLAIKESISYKALVQKTTQNTNASFDDSGKKVLADSPSKRNSVVKYAADLAQEFRKGLSVSSP